MSTITKSSAKAETKISSKKTPVKVVELVRRQGIYTGTLDVADVNEIDNILASFERKSEDDPVKAIQGAKVTELEFEGVGGRSGVRSYCLRLPNIQLADLEKIGFKKYGKLDMYVR